MDKISTMLYRAMLMIFLLLFGGGIALGFARGFEYRSYILAFAAAAVLLCAYWMLQKKLKNRSFLCDTVHPVKLGVLISGICFVLNLLYVLLVRLEPTIDFHTFWITAEMLADGEALSNSTFVAAFPHILGYSAFLSLFIRIFGDNYLVAAVLNVFLTAFSCMLIYMLCLRFFGSRAACLAGLLWTVCPSKMMYNSMVLSEPYYTFLFLASVYMIAELHAYFGRGGKNPIRIALAAISVGACLALANAARPVAAVVILAFFIWLLFLRGNEMKQRSRWTSWLVFAAAMLMTYTITGNVWTDFAEKTVGQKVPSLPGYNMYVGLNTTNWGSYNEEDMALFEGLLYDGEHTVAEAQEKMLGLTKERLTSGKIDFGRLFAKKLQTFLGCDEGGAYYSQQAIHPLVYSATALISNIWYYALAGLVFVAVFRLLKKPSNGVFSLIPLFVLGLTLAQMLVEIAGRYHYSIIPMLVIMAATAVEARKKNAEVNDAAETLYCDSLL